MATIVTICLTLMKRIHFCPNGLFKTIFAHKAGATEISAKLAIATYSAPPPHQSIEPVQTSILSSSAHTLVPIVKDDV
jgi:hypothetical protein